MRHQCSFGTALAAIFACGQLALAQPSAIPTNQTSTTGMVGFTTNQTARLNVLNLNPVTTSSATPHAAQLHRGTPVLRCTKQYGEPIGGPQFRARNSDFPRSGARYGDVANQPACGDSRRRGGKSGANSR